MPSHYEVAHAWAYQTGKQRNGKRMFYEGPSIYSHGRHFQIARLVDVKGVPSVLFTTRKYSVSTSQHTAIAHSAVSHLPIYYVGDPGRFPILEDWEADLTSAAGHVAKSKRARLDRNRDWELSSAQTFIDRANALRAAFDIDAPEVSLETLGVAVAGLEERIAKAQRKAELARKKAEKERFKREAEARTAWLAGDSNAYWRGTTPEGFAFLRIKGEEVQTSQGAAVPLAHAIKAFRFIKLVRERAQPWHRNGHSVRVGNFSVDEIDKAGNIKAGCHLIAWQEIERIALQIGVLDAPASEEALQPSSAAA